MAKSLEKTFAARLRKAREEHGSTQRDVALAIGMAPQAYSRIEMGYVLPRAKTLVALAKLLGVSADFLLGLAPVPPRLLRRVGEPKHGYAAKKEDDTVEVRRLIRRARLARPETVRLLNRVAMAIERDGKT